MTDWHTHIGQYFDSYYDFHDVFDVLKKNGIDETVCAYLTPKFDDAKTSLSFFHAVEEELENARVYAKSIGLKVSFLYWADPLVLKALSLKTIFSRFSYSGIALHPRLHNWTTSFSDLLTRIFDFSREQNIPIFIHTGISKEDEPKQFEKWFKDFPDVEIHLAHCKATEQIIELFSSFKNLFGDTAFCPQDSYEKICNAGFKNRMLFGSDFPITHWYVHKEDKKVDSISLDENYKQIARNNCEI